MQSLLSEKSARESGVVRITNSFDEFIKKKESNNLICFGSGKYLDIFLEKMKGIKLEEGIKIIVDNNEVKWGTIKEHNSSSYEIISPMKMLRDITPNDVILITTLYYNEVLEQLDKLEKLEKTTCYVAPFLLLEKMDQERSRVSMPENIKIADFSLIPKKIHCCWFGGKEIPDENKKWMESWYKYCPDYEIIQWDESNYDIEKSTYMKQAYGQKAWAFVSDYARLDIVYNHGGIYLDTDVELIKPLDPFLYQKAFCGFESKDYVNFGQGYGSVKKNRIIGDIIDLYDSLRFINENGTINNTACPIYQTEVLKQYGLQTNGEYQLVDDMVVYPEKVFCAMSPHSYRIMEDFSSTYSVHHFAASWLEGKDLKVKKDVIDFWKRLIH
jgi:mannosyltransferase OCH1-like enzyme